MSSNNPRYRTNILDPRTFEMRAEFIHANTDEVALELTMERFGNYRWELFEGRRLVATHSAPEMSPTREHPLRG